MSSLACKVVWPYRIRVRERGALRPHGFGIVAGLRATHRLPLGRHRQGLRLDHPLRLQAPPLHP